MRRAGYQIVTLRGLILEPDRDCTTHFHSDGRSGGVDEGAVRPEQVDLDELRVGSPRGERQDKRPKTAGSIHQQASENHMRPQLCARKAKIDAHERLMLQAERYLDRPFVSLQTSPMQTWRA